MNMPMNTRDARLAALLGLLQPSEPLRPSGQPTHRTSRGHWDVLHYGDVVVWSCRCGRSEPITISARDSSNVLLPFDGIHACEICRAELQAASCKSERLLAWLNMHRATLDPKACLEFPEDGGLYKGPNDDRYQRTRRFIYTQFWRKEVKTEHCVRSKCCNSKCINPYHLCLTTKDTTLPSEARQAVEALIKQKISSGTIKQLLHEKLSIELSERSIQRIRRDITRSKSCAS